METELNNDRRHWNYADSAQRLLLAREARTILEALAHYLPQEPDGSVAEAYREPFTDLVNARGHVEQAIRRLEQM